MLTILVVISFFFCYTLGSVSSNGATSWAVIVQCRRPGLHCSEDCTRLEMCVFDNGGSSSFVVEYCGDLKCASPPGECSPEPSGPACTFKFACQSEGQFPHPYDCTQFCSCNADLEISCSFCNELGTAYNATSGKCDADVYQRICTENPVPLCEEPAGIYPLVEDPSIYYVCLPDDKGNLQPWFYKCKDGNEFDAESKQCSIFKCTAPGFFPDPSNCTNYYYCNPENLPTIHSCKNGTHYDPTDKKCINGTCSSPEDPVRCIDVGIFPDDKDCTMYYVCTPDLILSHVKCPVDTHFDRITEVCETGPCYGSGTTSSTTSTPPIDCPSAGLYPDPVDCTKYYFCTEDGTPIPQTCSSGYFDPEELKCVPGTCPSGTDPTTTSKPSSTPPIDCPSAGLYPDPDDCTKYYFCMEDGTPIPQTCSSGYFDPEELKCVPGTCPSGTDPTTTSKPPSTPPIVCPSAGLYPDPDDCTKYYFCTEDGTPIPQTCSSGYFDPEELKCVPGICPSGTDPTTTSKPSSTPPIDCPSAGLYPDPDDCTKYYFCTEDGTPIPQTCSSGYFDPVELKCVPGSCPPSFVCTYPGYFPNPQNCTTYFVCFDDLTFTERACRSGYHFDTSMRICIEGPCETSYTKSTAWCTILGFFMDTVDCSRYLI